MSLEKEGRTTRSDPQAKIQQKMGENSSQPSEKTETRAANIESQTLHSGDELKEENDRKIQQPQR
ncbi:hypothetical protein NG798_12800 [Ancylothrix sp. C2]|uniref:hypothetical protein n=1 Tax=Ancylothrix sp. D3o TaxID=2953691 RepID=UPI0021BA6C30|nr:hypothetical protein [Ancylothrix sp. D3o]MCT7950673.1 hypothetical protein [Ancylothrix sp. D3o]